MECNANEFGHPISGDRRIVLEFVSSDGDSAVEWVDTTEQAQEIMTQLIAQMRVMMIHFNISEEVILEKLNDGFDFDNTLLFPPGWWEEGWV